tara:strand:- start:2698 stop:3102 length:405 start_codon:yes stop_codon:yes gene_type:complete
MVHYFNIKKRLFILLFVNFIFSMILINFFSFKKIIRNLEHTRKKHPNIIINNKKIIFDYEKKISKIFGVNKCLISSICIFKTCKLIGLPAKLVIGVDNKKNKNQSQFTSHAWVEVDEHKIESENKIFFPILEIQ